MANKTCRTKTQVDLKKCFRRVNVFSHFWPCLIPCESRASLFFDEITECKRPPWLLRSKQSATGWSFSLNYSPLQAAGALWSQSSKVPAVNQVRVCFYVKFNFFFSLNTASVFSVYLTFQKKTVLLQIGNADIWLLLHFILLLGLELQIAITLKWIPVLLTYLRAAQ